MLLKLVISYMYMMGLQQRDLQLQHCLVVHPELYLIKQLMQQGR